MGSRCFLLSRKEILGSDLKKQGGSWWKRGGRLMTEYADYIAKVKASMFFSTFLI